MGKKSFLRHPAIGMRGKGDRGKKPVQGKKKRGLKYPHFQGKKLTGGGGRVRSAERQNPAKGSRKRLPKQKGKLFMS